MHSLKQKLIITIDEDILQKNKFSYKEYCWCVINNTSAIFACVKSLSSLKSFN